MTVLDLTPLAEESIRFIKKQNSGSAFRRVEYLAQVLFSLTDILADHLAEIDAIEIETKGVRQYFRGHGLTGSLRPRKER